MSVPELLARSCRRIVNTGRGDGQSARSSVRISRARPFVDHQSDLSHQIVASGWHERGEEFVLHLGEDPVEVPKPPGTLRRSRDHVTAPMPQISDLVSVHRGSGSSTVVATSPRSIPLRIPLLAWLGDPISSSNAGTPS